MSLGAAVTRISSVGASGIPVSDSMAAFVGIVRPARRRKDQIEISVATAMLVTAAIRFGPPRSGMRS
jgi:hypothetical protein